MRWRVVNRAPQLLILALNSGKTVHLAPNETSPPLENMELNGNAKVEKLLSRSSIALVPEATPPERPARTRRGSEVAAAEPEGKQEQDAVRESKESEVAVAERKREQAAERESKRDLRRK